MSTEDTKERGLRHNQGKLRYDLLHPVPIEGLVKVLTRGSIKYAPRNWEKGMPWSDVIASLKRHLAAFERGEDFDQETGLLHVDHLQCNAHFLSAYYKIAPQYDDRNHGYLTQLRIGLDIDDVLNEWCAPFCKEIGIPVPSSWFFGFLEKKEELIKAGFDYNKFMMELPVKSNPKEIPFEPVCYITNRGSLPVNLAEDWLAKNGFPKVPVIQTADKLTAAKEMRLDAFVDDKFETFVEMNRNGILCYLMDAPWNQRYNVGYKRIKSLKELAT